MSNFSILSRRERDTFDEIDNDDACFVQDQHDKQQSVGRHVAPLRHIFLIPNEQVFTLTTKCSVLSGEAANTYFMIMGFSTGWFKSMIMK